MRSGILLAALLLTLPAVACRKAAPPDETPAVSSRITTREITLFYESSDRRLLGETRSVPLPENPAAAVAPIVRELLKPPGNPAASPLFPGGVEVRAGYLLSDGTAIVDLGGALLSSGWNTGTHAEMMAVYGVVQTVTTNLREVRRVRLLVNGQPAETLAGHVDIGKSLQPNPRLVVSSEGPAASGV